MRVGLFGGTFDPAHAGHAHVARTARKALGLNRVWWLVTPQNPLKAQGAPLAARLASAKARCPGRAHEASAIEQQLGLRYSADTVDALQRRYPGVRFVWIVGSDALVSFARWRRWARLLHAVPLLAVARPGIGVRARTTKPFQRFAHRRRPGNRSLPGAQTPAWAVLPTRLHPASSSALRAKAARSSHPTASSDRTVGPPPPL
jgi:nicotinate-nucleotide adenylyltransferase